MIFFSSYTKNNFFFFSITHYTENKLLFIKTGQISKNSQQILTFWFLLSIFVKYFLSPIFYTFSGIFQIPFVWNTRLKKYSKIILMEIVIIVYLRFQPKPKEQNYSKNTYNYVISFYKNKWKPYLSFLLLSLLSLPLYKSE